MPPYALLNRISLKDTTEEDQLITKGINNYFIETPFESSLECYNIVYGNIW